MFVLKFSLKDGRKMLLHDGEKFIGGNSLTEAERAGLENSAKAIFVGGFDYVEVTVEELAKMIGTTVENPSYKILSVHGGLIPFSAVEIMEK